MRFLCIAGIALLSAQACTFGVTQADVSVSSESALPFDTFTFDARAPALIGTTLVVRGDDLQNARSSAHILGLVTSSSEELRSIVQLPYTTQGSSLALGVQITGPRGDSMWIETLTVRLPQGSNVIVTSPIVNVDIDGIQGVVTVQDARDVSVRHGHEVQLHSTGNIHAQATSGAIASDVGNIALTLDTPLEGPFALSTRIGDVEVTRSPSTGFMLVIDSPDCMLELDGRITHVQGHFAQEVGAGGPRVHIAETQHLRIVNRD